jgi:hypothetical protein
LTGSDDDSRSTFPQAGNRVTTFQLPDCIADSVKESKRFVVEALEFFKFLLNQVRYDLRVGLRTKYVTPLKKGLTKWKEIVNDTVVDDADRTLTIDVRMGIRWSWCPVSCPTGVGYPHFRLESVSGQNLLKPLYPPCLFNDGKFVAIQNSNPTRIIAAILKPLESRNEDFYDIFFANVSKDAAHECSPPKGDKRLLPVPAKNTPASKSLVQQRFETSCLR